MEREQLEALRKFAKENGGQVAVAKMFGVSQGGLSQWITNGQVPLYQAEEVERITGISRIKLRPDDWWMYWPGLRRGKPIRGRRPAVATE